MGSMVLSTFMMFVPFDVEFVFLAILCVGFFGIYIPYQESKKKGEVWAPLRWLKKGKGIKLSARLDRTSKSGSDRISSARSDRRRQLEQLESLKNAGLIDGREYRQKRDDILRWP